MNLNKVSGEEGRASAAMAAGAGRTIGRAGQVGFTLLEVMASLAILGMGILMVIQLFSGGLGLAMAARGHTGAVLLAREKMSETLAETGLGTGTREGEGPEGLRWEVRVSPYETSLYASSPALEVLKITVSVEGEGRGQGGYTLTSLKSRWIEEK